ncbi:MAG: rhodanese-like domain-containing protein [Gammaproteobacteria bacterium]|nr:rhodanese-like domain-containing protein [Gammaproteobacteria bacterium]
MRIRLLGFLFLIFQLAGCTKLPYNNLDNEQLEAMLRQGIPIIDVRRPEEWQQTGVIAGSIRLTFVDHNGQLLPDFLPRLTEIAPKNDPVILICRTGNRTDVLARHLVEYMGYTKVYNVKDGITRWISAGKPVNRL